LGDKKGKVREGNQESTRQLGEFGLKKTYLECRCTKRGTTKENRKKKATKTKPRKANHRGLRLVLLKLFRYGKRTGKRQLGMHKRRLLKKGKSQAAARIGGGRHEKRKGKQRLSPGGREKKKGSVPNNQNFTQR